MEEFIPREPQPMQEVPQPAPQPIQQPTNFQTNKFDIDDELEEILAKQKAKSAAVIFGAKSSDSVSMIVAVTDDLIKKLSELQKRLKYGVSSQVSISSDD